MALHRKLSYLVELKPDIAIVPECADPSALTQLTGRSMPRSIEWVGDLPRKGLGTITFGDYTIARDPCHNPDFKYFLPLHIQGPFSFRLLAVWAFDRRSPAGGRGLSVNATGFMYKALEQYHHFLADEPVVVAGDFNNHVLWDKPGKRSNHINTVHTLNDLGLTSAYHHARSVCQGGEVEHTLLWGALKFHIDYCFIPKSWQARLESVKVGEEADWKALSDHLPLIIDIDI